MHREAPLKSASLPPRDSLLIDPRTEKLLTPVDDRGLVIIPQLITDVKSVVDPDYQWPEELSVHHFYWHEAWYPYTKESPTAENPAIFRNLPIHKGLVIRAFENLLHIATIPPKPPEPEVQKYRVEAYLVVRDLFKMARRTIQWEKRARRRRELVAANPDIIPAGFNGEDIIGEEIMHEVLEKNFRGFERQLIRQEAIPEKHRIIQLDGTPHKMARDLGKLVARPSLHLVRSISA